VTAYVVFEIQNDGSLSNLSTVIAPGKSYTHTGLINGNVYSYIVQAIDAYGNTDGNTNAVSAMTFAGVSSAGNLGNAEATFYFNPGLTPQALSFNAYCATGGGAYVLAGSVAAPSSDLSVTSLTANTAYVCRVKAVNPAGIEDGNTATISITTRGYQGVVLASAYGPAPNAPTSPTAAQVSLTWQKFLGATNTTYYKVVRVNTGFTADMTASTFCTSATQTSCLVCWTVGGNSNGGTVNHCTDLNVAASPQQYDYLIASAPVGTPMNSTAWQLPVIDSPYRVTVPIPPANMVLVQQDSANFEMCQLMGKTSDPLNKQRCSYSGLGAVPYNTNPGNNPLNLPPNYYDFGYNLFVDRFGLGCAWTSTANGGFCGASHAAGNCFGNGAPASTIGVSGNVYYEYSNGMCYLNNGGTWTSGSGTGYPALATNAPGGSGYDVPPLVYVTQGGFWNICQGMVDPNYGPKRLMRRREFVAAAAWATATENSAMTTSYITGTLQGGSNLTITHACNTNNGNGITPGAFNTTDLANYSNTGTSVYATILGSNSTSACVSRYGAQDMIGNGTIFQSDMTGPCSGSGSSYVCGAGSSLDSGDLDFNTLPWDGVTGAPGGFGAVSWYFSSTPSYGSQFVAPLGLPLATTASSSLGGVPIGSSPGQFNPLLLEGAFFYQLAPAVATGRPFHGGGTFTSTDYASRFNLYFNVDVSTEMYYKEGARCAIPAE